MPPTTGMSVPELEDKLVRRHHIHAAQGVDGGGQDTPNADEPTDDARSASPTLDHMTQQPADLFTAIDHVGVAVSDLDEAITFYRDTYGMTLLHQEVNQEQGVREAMMGVGASGSCIQLLAPLSPSSTIAAFLKRSGPGIQQIAYRVTDLDEVSATLRQRGMRLLYDTPRRGTSESRVNFIHPKDAGGILVELVEPAPTVAS